MEVNVKINKLIDKNSLKAIATIGLDNIVCIPNIRIIDGEYGPFVGYPNQGEKEVIKFVESDAGKDLKKQIQDAVIEKYNEALKDESMVGYKYNYTDEEKESMRNKAKENLDKIRVSIGQVYSNSDSRQKAIGDIILDNTMYLKGIRLIENQENQLFVAMPSRSYEVNGDKKYNDIFYGLTKEVKEKITERAIENYDKKRQSEEESNSSHVDDEEDEMER